MGSGEKPRSVSLFTDVENQTGFHVATCQHVKAVTQANEWAQTTLSGHSSSLRSPPVPFGIAAKDTLI